MARDIRRLACERRDEFSTPSARITSHVCGSMDLGPAEAPAGSLLSRLQAGDVPEWLEPLPEFHGQPFAVYRIRR